MQSVSDKTSYPLAWPDRWPRAKTRSESKFFSGNQWGKTMTDARRGLQKELDRLGASAVILSTNTPVRLDGAPYANVRASSDPGAAVYFTFRSKQVSFACDKWLRVEDNIWAIAKHIEALRGQERWGVGTIEQAFRGYMAIPERSEASAWHKVLQVPINASREQITAARDRLAKQHHPDVGGTNGDMAAINLAYAEAIKEAQ